MKAGSTTEQRTYLTIAGLGFEITCNDPALLAYLADRYAAFTDPSKDNFFVSIQVVSHSGNLIDLSGLISFSDREMHFTGPEVEGLIDLDRMRANLNFSSQYAFQVVDYFLRVVLAAAVFKAGGMMLHAAGIVRRGLAYLFFGHSGSGKTTVSRLSNAELVLNDDLVVLMPAGRGWQVYGTPFWNPTQVQPNSDSAGLMGFFRLIQDKRVYLESMATSQAIAEMIANIPVLPADPGHNFELLSRIQSLVREFPCYRLHFLPDASFWQVIETLDNLSVNDFRI